MAIPQQKQMAMGKKDCCKPVKKACGGPVKKNCGGEMKKAGGKVKK